MAAPSDQWWAICHRWSPATTSAREDLTQSLDAPQCLVKFQARPVAAHHEVIDAERFAIPGDLVLHEGRVADDEAIAHILLERRLVARCHAPGRVGVVLVLQRAA